MSRIYIIFFVIVLQLYQTAIAQVNLEWAKRYNGPANDYDAAYAIAVDDSGNVYVTGLSTGKGSGFDAATIKYRSNGDTSWIRRWNSFSNGNEGGGNLVLDSLGNIYVAARWILKYDRGGNLLWVSADSNIAGEIALDNAMNIFAGVTTYNSDYLTSKLDGTGNTIWQRFYNGPGNNQDKLYGLALDKWGNVVVTGRSWGIGTQYDYTTIKYSNNGDTLWVRRYNGPAQNVPTDIAYSLAVDDSGNVYVTGWSDGATENPNCLTIKYNPNGDTVWLRRYPILSVGYEIELDNSGNLYIAAKTNGINYSVLKYNTDGDFIWERTKPGELFADPHSIAIDSMGNVYLACSRFVSSTRSDILIVKYDSNGNQKWEATYNGGSNNDVNFPNDITVNSSGNVYVTGQSVGTGTFYDYVTIKYSQVVSIKIINSEIPTEHNLYQNYPNPFNPQTKIRFDISSLMENKYVSINVYDVLGKNIDKLINEKLKAGSYEVEWNASDYASGIYFYKLLVNGSVIDTKKMILIK